MGYKSDSINDERHFNANYIIVTIIVIITCGKNLCKALLISQHIVNHFYSGHISRLCVVKQTNVRLYHWWPCVPKASSSTPQPIWVVMADIIACKVQGFHLTSTSFLHKRIHSISLSPPFANGFVTYRAINRKKECWRRYEEMVKPKIATEKIVAFKLYALYYPKLS